MEKPTRKSYYCNEEVAKIVAKYSTDMGISESAFVNLCIDNYHTQRVAINTMSNLDDIMTRLDNIEKTVKETMK